MVGREDKVERYRRGVGKETRGLRERGSGREKEEENLSKEWNKIKRPHVHVYTFKSVCMYQERIRTGD